MMAAAEQTLLRDAAAALRDDRPEIAERPLRQVLAAHPDNVDALKMLAEIAVRAGCHEDAEALLARCLECAPDFAAARYRYATLLFRQNKVHRALAEIERLLQDDPRNPECLALQAVALGGAGDYDGAIACHQNLLREHPDRSGAWLNYALDLKTAGRGRESIAAYRGAIARFPDLAEAYWALGNLKTFRFEAAEIDAMQVQLARGDPPARARCLLHFALGKALEDAGAFAQSFVHYASANALQRAVVNYDADGTTEALRRVRDVFTREFLDARAGAGCGAPDPIFIVGLARSGSTLIEQILSSHPAIEATMELPNIGALIDRLDGAYPEVLQTLDPEVFAALGEEYLDETRAHRRLGRRFFIDKMQENFRHAGLIHLILPNTKIVDARRHPMACGFSNFRQNFESFYGVSYDLADIGRYYTDYAALMAHFDSVLPGRIHRVFYERLVADPQHEVGLLLDYLGLPSDARCLRFHDNERPVRTASSEQVRLPIYTDALEQWRNYEPWLAPLKAALGPVLASYPDVPA